MSSPSTTAVCILKYLKNNPELPFGCFVTGTDTGVGKTHVSALLAQNLLEKGHCVHYIKPIQTGLDDGDDDAAFCSAAVSGNERFKASSVYRFGPPVSPHLAARLVGTQISTELILAKIQPEKDEFLIAEGAGGLFVPINEETTMLDIIEQSRLPVLLVAANRLGAINQALLSLEALKQRDANVIGVIFNNLSDPENAAQESIREENLRAVANFGKSDVLGEIPYGHFTK